MIIVNEIFESNIGLLTINKMEQEMENYRVGLVVSIALGSVPLVIFITCWAWQMVWAWVDDTKSSKHNKFITWMCYKHGYIDRDSEACPFYTSTARETISDGSGLFFLYTVLLLLTPTFALIAFRFYPVTIALATLCVIAYVSRFVRRLHKKFHAHVVNPDAHKN